MNLEDYIHLFTPVGEMEVKTNVKHDCILIHHEEQFRATCILNEWGSSGKTFWNILNGILYFDPQPEVTHILDLSKLTTIEKAKEAIERAYATGWNDRNVCHTGYEVDSERALELLLKDINL